MPSTDSRTEAEALEEEVHEDAMAAAGPVPSRSRLVERLAGIGARLRRLSGSLTEILGIIAHDPEGERRGRSERVRAENDIGRGRG